MRSWVQSSTLRKIFLFNYLLLRMRIFLILWPWPASHLLCRSGLPWIHRDPPPASQVPFEIQVCAIRYSLKRPLYSNCLEKQFWKIYYLKLRLEPIKYKGTSTIKSMHFSSGGNSNEWTVVKNSQVNIKNRHCYKGISYC